MRSEQFLCFPKVNPGGWPIKHIGFIQFEGAPPPPPQIISIYFSWIIEYSFAMPPKRRTSATTTKSTVANDNSPVATVRTSERIHKPSSKYGEAFKLVCSSLCTFHIENAPQVLLGREKQIRTLKIQWQHLTRTKVRYLKGIKKNLSSKKSKRIKSKRL